MLGHGELGCGGWGVVLGLEEVVLGLCGVVGIEIDGVWECGVGFLGEDSLGSRVVGSGCGV